MPSSTPDPCTSTAPSQNPSKLGPDAQPASPRSKSTEDGQLELQLFEYLDAFRGRPPEKAIFREHLKLLLRKGCEYVIGNRRITPATVYAVATAIYLRTVNGVAHVSHRQLAEDAFTTKRTVTAAIGVLQTIGLIQVMTSQIRRDAACIALYVGNSKWPAFCRRFRRRPSTTHQLELLPTPEARGDDSSPRARAEDLDTTTRGRLARPPATAAQVQFAEDLGVDPTGKDLVDLGEAIERARQERAEMRAAASGQQTRQQTSHSPVLHRRLAEAQAYGHTAPVEQNAPEDPDTAAAERHRRALETAAAVGYEPVPEDPDVMIRRRDGHRIWVGAPARSSR